MFKWRNFHTQKKSYVHFAPKYVIELSLPDRIWQLGTGMSPD